MLVQIEDMKKDRKIDRAKIRGLLVSQKGRCAITGQKLTPFDVTLDHIIPISHKKMKNKKEYGEVWLVSKKINAMKGALTMQELYEVCSMVVKNKKNTKSILKKILQNGIKKIEKTDFDKYIKNNYLKNGKIRL